MKNIGKKEKKNLKVQNSTPQKIKKAGTCRYLCCTIFSALFDGVRLCDHTASVCKYSTNILNNGSISENK